MFMLNKRNNQPTNQLQSPTVDIQLSTLLAPNRSLQAWIVKWVFDPKLLFTVLNAATSAMVTQHDETRWHKMASSANTLWTLMLASILFNFVVGLLNYPVDTILLLMVMHCTIGLTNHSGKWHYTKCKNGTN